MACSISVARRQDTQAHMTHLSDVMLLPVFFLRDLDHLRTHK